MKLLTVVLTHEVPRFKAKWEAFILFAHFRISATNSFFFFLSFVTKMLLIAVEKHRELFCLLSDLTKKKNHSHMLQIISKVNSSRSSLKKYIASRAAVSIDT